MSTRADREVVIVEFDLPEEWIVLWPSDRSIEETIEQLIFSIHGSGGSEALNAQLVDSASAATLGDSLFAVLLATIDGGPPTLGAVLEIVSEPLIEDEIPAPHDALLALPGALAEVRVERIVIGEPAWKAPLHLVGRVDLWSDGAHHILTFLSDFPNLLADPADYLLALASSINTTSSGAGS